TEFFSHIAHEGFFLLKDLEEIRVGTTAESVELLEVIARFWRAATAGLCWRYRYPIQVGNFTKRKQMGRYLCQLCYTIVNYGEKHPCFDYRNDDYVYSLPDLGDSNKMDTKNGELTANSNDNSVVIFTEEQENNAENA
ncbi:hypothetical protein AVEN_174630-1, partial [Araneus ventricosus]